MENSIKQHRKIMASASRVWEVLLDPNLTKEWAYPFYPGTWVEADWKKGGLVIWKAGEGQIGAKGIVTAIERNQLIEISYFDEIDMEPAGPTGKYKETFTLSSIENKTLLSVEAGPLDRDNITKHSPMWEQALEIIQQLAENKN